MNRILRRIRPLRLVILSDGYHDDAIIEPQRLKEKRPKKTDLCDSVWF